MKIFICNHYAFGSTPIINKNNDTFDIFIKYLIKKSAYDRITSQRASELKVKVFKNEIANTEDGCMRDHFPLKKTSNSDPEFSVAGHNWLLVRVGH